MRCKETVNGVTTVALRYWKEFKAGCPKINQLCSGKSKGFLPAAAVCAQGLATGTCDLVAKQC